MTSCGDSPESLAEDSMDVMKEIIAVMKEVILKKPLKRLLSLARR